MFRAKSFLPEAFPSDDTLASGWQVVPQWHPRASDEELHETRKSVPTKFRSELLVKAGGAIFVLTSLLVTWTLSLLFATKFAHIGVAGFNVIVTLQFLLWTILRQGMSIVALVAFDICYSTNRKGKKRRSLSLYTLDAWASLFITPINVLRGKLLNVLLVLLPGALSIFATYATSSLLGKDTTFRLLETANFERVAIGPAGGGFALHYVMTGQNFIYNASEGCLATPNNRFVYVMSDHQILVPSIPTLGTYGRVSGYSMVRAARITKIPAVLATITPNVTSDRETFPATDVESTTVPGGGDIFLKTESIDKSSSLIKVKILMHARNTHRQISFDILYQTVEADLDFATFKNGTHISNFRGWRPAFQNIPERLNGAHNLSMDSVLDNFILSQNGDTLLRVVNSNDTAVKNLGLLLAGAFGIRSATNQNWIDGAGEREVQILEEREIVLVPLRYWIVAGSMSTILAIACLLMCSRRPTINGNLVQLVALMDRSIQECQGACTPNWQKAFVQSRIYEEVYMNRQVVLGYSADHNGEKEIVTLTTEDNRRLLSYHITFDKNERVNKDDLGVLYGLLAGTPRGRRYTEACNYRPLSQLRSNCPTIQYRPCENEPALI